MKRCFPLVTCVVAVIFFATAIIWSCSHTSSDETTQAVKFTIGGTVSGLTGTLVLQNNAADDLTLTANGAFTFAASLAKDETYAVTVKTQPTGYTCSISNGSGAVSGTDVTNVTVVCSNKAYTVGGTVSGLSGTLVLQNNKADDLTLTADGTFTFAAAVADGAAYAVTVSTQPTDVTCSIAEGSGTIVGANVTNVAITCSADIYTVGGSVSGLSGTVVLHNNGGDSLSISSNGAFTFATAVADGGSYAVTVATQPTGQTCSVSSGAGTIAAADVTNVSVICAAGAYTVGGTVSGLSGTVVLRNNGGDSLSVSSAGSFTFATAVADGGSYAVTVATQPTGQTCSVSSGIGTIAAANVTDVSVNCTTNTYTVGGTVSGLSGTVVLKNNGSDSLSISSDGAFVFGTPIAHGGSYAVTVTTQPAGQTCSVTSGSGTIDAANVTNVSISCVSSYEKNFCFCYNT